MSAGGVRVAVVVAATEAGPAAVACLERFAAEVAGRGEVVLVDGSRAGIDAAAVRGVRTLRRPGGLLVPALWGAGWQATDAPLVALSTAAMCPEPGWLDALLARLAETGAAVVGGPVAPAEGLTATDRAVYLLRYVAYMPPVPGPPPGGPPGENALYRRDRLAGLDHLDSEGFWEAEVYEHLRRRGESLTLALADGAAVRYGGGGGLPGWAARRFRHARAYGCARGRGRTALARSARAAAAPAVPWVMARRIVAGLKARGALRASWLPALPALGVLLAAWAAGEAYGLLSGGAVADAPRRRAPAAVADARTVKGEAA